jgi:hypothetical protein
MSNEPLSESGIERLRLNPKPRLVTAAHRGNQSQLITVMKHVLGRHICLVDHEHGHRSHAFETRIFPNELREYVPGCGTLGHLPPLGRETEDLTDDGKVSNVNVHGTPNV